MIHWVSTLTMCASSSPIFVLSYQRALRLQKEIAEAPFDLVVLDEGQFVKNVQTKTACCVAKEGDPGINESGLMAKVLFSASAENDLLGAWLYVAEDSVTAADRMLDQIDAETIRLLDQPLMGRERNELSPGMRCWPT